MVLGGSVHSGEVDMAEFMECYVRLPTYVWGSGSVRLPAYSLVDQKMNWSGRNSGQAITQKT